MIQHPEPTQKFGIGTRPRWSAGVALVASALFACSDPSVHPDGSESGSFSVVVAVHAERDAPVAGARVLSGKRELGQTDASGLSRLRLQGRDGQTVPLSVECPPGFSSPEAPLPVALRELASGSPPPRYQAHCTATTHSVLVAIRADNGANLPILPAGPARRHDRRRGHRARPTSRVSRRATDRAHPGHDAAIEPPPAKPGAHVRLGPARRARALEQQFSRLAPKRKVALSLRGRSVRSDFEYPNLESRPGNAQRWRNQMNASIVNALRGFSAATPWDTARSSTCRSWAPAPSWASPPPPTTATRSERTCDSQRSIWKGRGMPILVNPLEALPSARPGRRR